MARTQQQPTPLASAAIQKVYVDRSRHLDYQRCKRLRWLGYHAGSTAMGLQPVRKSIHLVLGSAVHAGQAVLLWESQIELYALEQFSISAGKEFDLQLGLEALFGPASMRPIEDAAVAAALADLAVASAHGVELDDQERLDSAKLATASATGSLTSVTAVAGGDSAIMIEFSDFDATTGQFKMEATGALAGLPPGDYPAQVSMQLGGAATATTTATSAALTEQLQASIALEAANQTTSVDWATPVYIAPKPDLADLATTSSQTAGLADLTDPRLEDIQITHAEANAQRSSGIDSYLAAELAAQVEAMVRAYARRRLRPLLEQFQVLEVEREGEWKLGEVTEDWEAAGTGGTDVIAELWFMSRHDALLLERQTGFLYLESFKTTGAWDRRRAADAEVDMQGLSEAVDVEKRLATAWQHIASLKLQENENSVTALERGYSEIAHLVNRRTADWVAAQPEPPRILGVRYEYLIKGARRADKKDQQQPGRYVCESPLIRAWKQDGLTADDRRWMHSYDYYDLLGKSKRLDYRSWAKAPVWQFMTIADWIDKLDRGEVQPDSYDADGHPLDVLAEQFVSPITCYRNEDDMRDMLEQLEAEEVQVAIDVAAVQAVASQPAKLRSELNRRFSQSRKSCMYPGRCQNHAICYGGSDIRQNPEASELYQIRQPNHLQELA